MALPGKPHLITSLLFSFHSDYLTNNTLPHGELLLTITFP